MLHTRIAAFEKLDRGDVATALLGTLVALMSATIAVLIYMPMR